MLCYNAFRRQAKRGFPSHSCDYFQKNGKTTQSVRGEEEGYKEGVGGSKFCGQGGGGGDGHEKVSPNDMGNDVLRQLEKSTLDFAVDQNQTHHYKANAKRTNFAFDTIHFPPTAAP